MTLEGGYVIDTEFATPPNSISHPGGSLLAPIADDARTVAAWLLRMICGQVRQSTLTVMPRYEFRCRECSMTFELSRPMTASGDPARCPAGHDDTVKLLSTVALSSSAAMSPAAPGSSRSAAPALSGGGCCGGGCCG